jgi:hypothetical protein
MTYLTSSTTSSSLAPVRLASTIAPAISPYPPSRFGAYSLRIDAAPMAIQERMGTSLPDMDLTESMIDGPNG